MMLRLWILGFICNQYTQIDALMGLGKSPPLCRDCTSTVMHNTTLLRPFVGCSGVNPHDSEQVIQSINMMVTCGSDSIVARYDT